MTNEISRRLLLKLASAAGAVLALPPIIKPALAAVENAAPFVEYFEGGKWVTLGNLIDVNLNVSIDTIYQGPGRSPMKGLTTSTLNIEYKRSGADPFVDMAGNQKLDIRVIFPNQDHRLTCHKMQANAGYGIRLLILRKVFSDAHVAGYADIRGALGAGDSK
jgi:hypothetical protein